MRGLFKWFILLIGMISFMGFSSTTDLPENSTVVFTDNDVGVKTISVEKYYGETVILNNYLNNYYSIVFHPYLKQVYSYPFIGNNTALKKLFKTTHTTYIFRSPRDSLNC